MSKRIYVIVMALVLMNFHSNATVKTLNNNHPSPGQYSSWAQVQSTLAMGDTIYVSGSPFSYGDIDISGLTSFDVTIIGTGFQPSKQMPLKSQFGVIYISGYSNPSKIKLIGLNIHKLMLLSFVELLVQKCYIESGANIKAKNNSIVESNIIKLNSASFNNEIIGNDTSIRIQVRNNVIIEDTGQGYYSFMKNVIFYNNIHINGYLSLYGNSQSPGLGANCMLYNNVFIHTSVISTNPLQDMAMYNCFDANSSTNVNNGNNLFNTNPLLVNPVLNYANVIPLNWDMHLQAGSPCIGTGVAFADMGVYGGMYGSGFTMTGEPNIPQIKQMNLPATVIKGQTFNVDLISTNK